MTNMTDYKKIGFVEAVKDALDYCIKEVEWIKITKISDHDKLVMMKQINKFVTWMHMQVKIQLATAEKNEKQLDQDDKKD